MSEKPTITVSSRDFDRIEALIARAPDKALYADLQAELNRAAVVESEDMPADIVTMNSTVRLVDVDNGKELTLSLVFPNDVVDTGTVSILAPVGSALLGLTVNQQIDWPLPNGRDRRLRVLEISYQPEASGEFHR